MSRAAARRLGQRTLLLCALALALPVAAAPPAGSGSGSGHPAAAPAPSGLPYTGRNDELFGLMPTAARRAPAAGLRIDQQDCEHLARLAGVAADIGNRAGQQDALRQMRDADCPP